MYTLSVQRVISTAHQLRDYDGPCARVHGHNWRIKLDVEFEKVNDTGIAIDFTDLDKKLWDIIGPFDHQFINTVPPFDKLNPTAENLVKYLYHQLQPVFAEQVSLKRVSVWENNAYMVSYEE